MSVVSSSRRQVAARQRCRRAMSSGDDEPDDTLFIVCDCECDITRFHLSLSSTTGFRRCLLPPWNDADVSTPTQTNTLL